jgi:hypothetical protein
LDGDLRTKLVALSDQGRAEDRQRDGGNCGDDGSPFHPRL